MKNTLGLTLILTFIAGSAMAESAPAKPAPEKAPLSSSQESYTGKIPHADEVKNMRKTRMAEYMERTWKEIDTNNDGVITREESTAFSNKKFDDKDINKDGKITKEEWDAYREEKMKEAREKFGIKNSKTDSTDKKLPADRKTVGGDTKK